MAKELRGLVLRHGTTTLNEKNQLKGLLDPPLDDKGMLDAAKAAQWLRQYDIQTINASPLLRSMQTAEIASGVLGGLCIHQDRRLFPWAFGTEFMGVVKDEPGTKGIPLEHYIDNPDEEPENGESLANVRNRVRAYFIEKLSIPELALYISHNSIIVTLSDLVNQTESGHPESGDVVDPGGVVGIYVDGKEISM